MAPAIRILYSLSMKLVKRIIAGLGACSALAFAIGAVAPGCVESEAQFYIVSSSPVKFSMDSDPTCDSGSEGFCSALDIGSGSGSACFLVASGLIPRAKDDTNHSETNRIIINQVDLELLNASGAAIDSFSAPANGYIDPHPPEAGSMATFAFPVVRTEGSSQLAPGERFVIGVILKGRTTGGLDLETPEFFLSGQNGNSACGSTGDGTCCVAF